MSFASNETEFCVGLMVKHRSSGPRGKPMVVQSRLMTTRPVAAKPKNLTSFPNEAKSPTSSSVCPITTDDTAKRHAKTTNADTFLFMKFLNIKFLSQSRE